MRTARMLAVAAASVVVMVSGCNAPRPLPSVQLLGDRAFSAGDYQTAAGHYEEYVLRKPGDAAVEHQFARTLLLVNQPGRAIEHATIAYDQFPNSEAYADTLAEAYLAAGKTDELNSWLRGNIEGRGTVSDYIRQGRFALRMGDPDGAELALVTAAKVDQGRTLRPQMELANLYKAIGDKKNEVRRLRMAMYVDPTNVEIGRRLRELGEIPGPTLALRPEEASSTATAPQPR